MSLALLVLQQVIGRLGKAIRGTAKRGVVHDLLAPFPKCLRESDEGRDLRADTEGG